MLKARKFVENVYYHELAKALCRFGYGIRNLHRGDFQVEGVSEEICERFSKRHEQIDQGLRELLERKPELAGGNRKDLRERLATAERSRKMRDIPRSQLEELWTAQLSKTESEI
jgi:conjugative relaxase-like TrwC/TraI family protein